MNETIHSPRLPSLLREGHEEAAPDQSAATGFFTFPRMTETALKHKWLVLGAALLGLFIAIVHLFVADPVYRATGTMELNASTFEVVEGSDVEQADQAATFLETQIGLLQTRRVALQVVREITPAAGIDTSEGATLEDVENARADALIAKTDVASVTGTQLVSVSVFDEDPEMAATLTNRLMQAAIDDNLNKRIRATEYARDFLEERLDEARRDLEQSERQLAGYARSAGIVNLTVSSGDGGSRETTLDAESLTGLTESLAVATAERLRLEALMNTGGASSAAASQDSTLLGSLRTEMVQLEREYTQKREIFKPDYPEMVSLSRRIDALRQQISNERSRSRTEDRGDLQRQYAAARELEQGFRQRIENLRLSVLDERDANVGYATRMREVEANRQLYETLLERANLVNVGANVGESQLLIVDRAEVPAIPVSPDPFRVLPVWILLGLLGGLAGAFIIEVGRDRIVTVEDAKKALQVPILGAIPAVEKETDIREQLAENLSSISEAYITVRTALQYATEHGLPRAMLVTSTQQGEGKTTTSFALASKIAALGHKVLLIDADMRRPSLRAPAEFAANPGLSDILARRAEAKNAIYPVVSQEFSAIHAGPIPPNPADLLTSDRFADLVRDLRDSFEIIVVDGPPLLGLADSIAISRSVEGVLFVIDSDHVRRSTASAAIQRLRAGGANVLGGVLTKYRPVRGDYGGHSYYYYQYGRDRDREGSADDNEESAEHSEKFVLR